MKADEKQREVQAVVFASGEPLEIARLAQAVDLTKEEALGVVEEINASYRRWRLPFELSLLGDSVQMCALPKYAPLIRDALALGRSVPLSQAALEVLAIVAYNQPVTKSFVEQVRGVDSSGVMNSLTQKQLIEEAGRLELPGRPISYRTTAHFLRCFSLSSLEELPLPDRPAESPQKEPLPADEPRKDPAREESGAGMPLRETAAAGNPVMG